MSKQVQKKDKVPVWLWIVLFLVGLSILHSFTGGDYSKPASNDITSSATTGQYDSWRAIVLANGYSCDTIKKVWSLGKTEYGDAVEVWCGPQSGDDLWTKQHYAVYIDQLSAKVCGSMSCR